jgi:hypothetical protein
MPPPTQFTASWTGNHSTGWFGDQHKAPILLDNDQHDLPRIRSATHELPTAAHLVCHPSVITANRKTLGTTITKIDTGGEFGVWEVTASGRATAGYSVAPILRRSWSRILFNGEGACAMLARLMRHELAPRFSHLAETDYDYVNKQPRTKALLVLLTAPSADYGEFLATAICSVAATRLCMPIHTDGDGHQSAHRAERHRRTMSLRQV